MCIISLHLKHVYLDIVSKYRSFNDGFQPWFYDRQRFGLRSVGSFESLCTEEGLAAINTTLRAKEKFLWLSALTYCAYYLYSVWNLHIEIELLPLFSIIFDCESMSHKNERFLFN